MKKDKNAKESQPAVPTDDVQETASGRLHIRLLTVVLVVVFVFVGVKFVQQYARIGDMREEAKTYEVQYQAALAEQKDLEKQKELLKDDDYIERLVREKLGLVKDGEILVVETKDDGDAVEYDGNIDPSDIH